MAKYTTFSPLYNNTGLGAAAKNFQSTMFGGGGGGASEMDPSQIYANEQLAQQRKAQAALHQQKLGAWNQAMEDPSFNPMMFNSNILQGRKAEGVRAGNEALAEIMTQNDPQSEAYNQALFGGLLGKSMFGTGEYGAFSPGQRADNITIANEAEMARKQADIAGQSQRNQADNARAITTNAADNARELDQTKLTNDTNVLRSLLNPVQAGAQRFNPPSVVDQYSVDAIQAAPAKSTTSGSGSSSTGWVSDLSPMQVKNIQSNWFNQGYRKDNPKFKNNEKLPRGFYDQMLMDVYKNVNEGGLKTKDATNARMEELMKDGLVEFDFSTGFFGSDTGVIPKKVFENFVAKYKQGRDNNQEKETISKIQDRLVSLGYSEQELPALLDLITSK